MSNNFNPLLRQIRAVLGPGLHMVAHGITFGFSSNVLAQIEETNLDDYDVNTIEHDIKLNRAYFDAWIAAIIPLALSISTYIGGFLMNKFGRRRTHIAIAFLMMIGFVTIAFSRSVLTFLIGRFITGFGIGVSSPPITAYVAEITQPKYRPVFLGINALGVTVGLLLIHASGIYFTWKTSALLSLIILVLSVVCSIGVPESYISYKSVEKQAWAFHWFRGDDEAARSEFQALKANISAPKIRMNEYRKSYFIKSVITSTLLFTMMQCCGLHPIGFYCTQIMQQSIPKLDKYLATIVFDVVRILFVLVVYAAIQKFPLRPLTYVSGFSTSILLVILASVLQFIPDLSNYLTLFLLLCYSAASTALSCMPWSYCGELFTPKTKALGSAIAISINGIAFFAVVKSYTSMQVAIGNSGVFFIYGFIVVAITFVLLFLLPETKNKSLADVEMALKK